MEIETLIKEASAGTPDSKGLLRILIDFYNLHQSFSKNMNSRLTRSPNSFHIVSSSQTIALRILLTFLLLSKTFVIQLAGK